jgi:hypothetical protein
VIRGYHRPPPVFRLSGRPPARASRTPQEVQEGFRFILAPILCRALERPNKAVERDPMVADACPRPDRSNRRSDWWAGDVHCRFVQPSEGGRNRERRPSPGRSVGMWHPWKLITRAAKRQVGAVAVERSSFASGTEVLFVSVQPVRSAVALSHGWPLQGEAVGCAGNELTGSPFE